MKRWLTPALVLFLLSPAIGELLSSSSPPAEFFKPLAFLLLASLYGSGALLVRELAHRWGGGWSSVLLLGAAYGIVEEGLAVKSFFDPGWMDLGPLAVYGRWAGTNWVWALGLTIYHAVFSIGIPILLVGLMFPAQRHRPWLTTRGLRVISALFAVTTMFIHFALTPYRPPLAGLILAAAAVVGLGWWARRVPAPRVEDAGAPPTSPRRLAVAGFAATLGLFFLLWFLPNTPLPALVWMGLVVAYVAWLWISLGRKAMHPRWTALHAWALATGALTFFILLSPLIEIDRNRTDNRSGMTLVGLATAAGLIWLGRRLRVE
ncbi:MAG TPA: hypothetical protein VLD63_06915, partial [Anaerolineales bacterium]|nr:hypothetical protein [Anaerolineales bacterium]